MVFDLILSTNWAKILSMISKLVRRQLFRFCANKDQLETRDAGFLTEAQQKKDDEVPVHLRPYDKQKYEVISPTIKRNSGTIMSYVRLCFGSDRALPSRQDHENCIQYSRRHQKGNP